MQSCQECGRLICWDVESGSGDDVVRPAYGTASGDLYCDLCGSARDRDEEAAEEAEAADCDFYPHDEV